MRFFAEITFLGTDFAGWQKQPGVVTVQSVLEEILGILFRQSCPVVGCGRTDTGVHAWRFYLHFDAMESLDTSRLTFRLNRMLPESIAIRRIYQVPDLAHARFDALSRTYQYHLHREKDPFRCLTSWHYPFWNQLDEAALHECAALIRQYKAFYPFCKSRSDASHYRVDLQEISWKITEKDAVLTITANRFLRGMVRLITGSSLEVARGKIPLERLRDALDKQTRLTQRLSAAPQGLHLMDVRYPSQLQAVSTEPS